MIVSAIASAKTLDDFPSHIKTTKQLAEWYSGEFKYRMEYPDNWQTPDETIKFKGGDCEDFALLTSEFLARQGVPHDVIIIKFKGLDMTHAICIWREKKDEYAFISNRKIIHTGETDINIVLNKYYPDWENFSYVSPENPSLRRASRSYSPRSIIR